jgi:hypothetical protein
VKLFLPFRTPFFPSPSLIPVKAPILSPDLCPPRYHLRRLCIPHSLPTRFDERRRRSPKRPPFTAMSTSLRRSIVRAGRAGCVGEVEALVLPSILFFPSRRWSRDQSEDDAVIDEYSSARIVCRGRSVTSFSTIHASRQHGFSPNRRQRPLALRIGSNEHWRYISSYHVCPFHLRHERIIPFSSGSRW